MSPLLRRALWTVGLIGSLLGLAWVLRGAVAGLARQEVSLLALLQTPVWWTSVALYLVQFALLAAAWQAILADAGARLGLGAALRIVAVSQAGKYLPGNLAHHVGRILLARRHGIDGGVAGVSILVEAGWVIGCGVAVVLVAGLLGFGEAVLPWPVALGVVAAMLAAVGWVLPWGLPRLAARFPFWAPAAAFRPTFFRASRYTAGMVVSYLNLGLILWLLARFWLGEPGLPLVACVGVVAGGWMAGFVTPGSPAGLGVREGVIALLLAQWIDQDAAIVLALVHRLVGFCGDGLAFALGSLASLKPFGMD